MKGLVLYGANCTLSIWEALKEQLSEYDLHYVDYPHEVLQKSQTLQELADWVEQAYPGPYDVLIGHSMGGLLALLLAQRTQIKQIILIETNLCPAKPFYRTLLTSQHQAAFKDEVMQMIRSEAPYYQEALKRSLQEDFDYRYLIPAGEAAIHVIYGDRGVPGYANRILDLNLGKDIVDMLQFHFLKDCAHMPMLENCEDLAQLLRGLLKQL